MQIRGLKAAALMVEQAKIRQRAAGVHRGAGNQLHVSAGRAPQEHSADAGHDYAEQHQEQKLRLSTHAAIIIQRQERRQP
jgi:hypothetical protein